MDGAQKEESKMNIMTKRGSQDNVVTYEHYCDAKADLANIPKNQITLGSTAIVLQDEDGGMGIYIAGSDKEWVTMSTSSGGSGGGTSLDFIHICASGEYNSQTLVPTVEFPEENVFYLVPNGGSNSDLFDEWIWTNDSWEKFGIGKVGPKGDTGAKGDTGEKGNTGTTFTPSVSSAGVISWTNDGGETNPASVDLVTAVINALPTATGVSF